MGAGVLRSLGRAQEATKARKRSVRIFLKITQGLKTEKILVKSCLIADFIFKSLIRAQNNFYVFLETINNFIVIKNNFLRIIGIFGIYN